MLYNNNSLGNSRRAQTHTAAAAVDIVYTFSYSTPSVKPIEQQT